MELTYRTSFVNSRTHQAVWPGVKAKMLRGMYALQNRILMAKPSIHAYTALDDNPYAGPMSLSDIDSIERRAICGEIRLQEADILALRTLREVIMFFHDMFPDSDPNNRRCYSLEL